LGEEPAPCNPKEGVENDPGDDNPAFFPAKSKEGEGAEDENPEIDIGAEELDYLPHYYLSLYSFSLNIVYKFASLQVKGKSEQY